MVLLAKLEEKRVGEHLGECLQREYQLGFDLVEQKREERV
jgi:hypothetical protein